MHCALRCRRIAQSAPIRGFTRAQKTTGATVPVAEELSRIRKIRVGRVGSYVVRGLLIGRYATRSRCQRQVVTLHGPIDRRHSSRCGYGNGHPGCRTHEPLLLCWHGVADTCLVAAFRHTTCAATAESIAGIRRARALQLSAITLTTASRERASAGSER